MTLVGEVTGHTPDVRTYQADDMFLDTNLVGVEIELENFSGSLSAAARSYWSGVGDPSLRHGGIELVLTYPLSGIDLVRAFESIRSTITHATAGERTSVHVHLDVRSWDSKLLQKFLLMYAVAEPILFKYIGQEREKNIYCWPFYHTEHVLRYIGLSSAKSSAADIQRLSRSFSSDHDKYGAVNMGSLRRLGSLEFRQFRGTTDVDDIIKWINIIYALKLGATTLSDNVDELYAQLEGMTYQQFIDAYFKGTDLSKATASTDLTTHYRLGLETLERILLYIPQKESKGVKKPAVKASRIPGTGEPTWAIGDRDGHLIDAQLRALRSRRPQDN
jgi:hypothetical protein